ncbi:MAG: DUF3618 domain-containing protein [Polymorphobacter sp.]
MASEPVERLASESAQARTRIAATIDEIQDRLDPRRIAAEAVDQVSTSSKQLVDVVGSTARAHPLAIGAAVAAIGLVLFTRNRLSKARVDLGDDLGDYTDYDDGFVFAETPADAKDVPPARAVRLQARAARLEARAQALAGQASETVDSNPVVSIIIGLAAGAALGALFPATEAERRVLGDAGGKLGDAARAAARRAADELDGAGLSVDKVRSGAARAARSVASAARDGLKG